MMWIKTDTYYIRSDLLERLEISACDPSLLKASPAKPMGNASSRRYNVLGWVRDGETTLCFQLAEGFRTYRLAEEAIGWMLEVAMKMEDHTCINLGDRLKLEERP